MHRPIRDRLEEVLAGSPAGEHLKECEDCRGEVAAMREQAALLQVLRTPSEAQVEPRAGFYARVMERIEAQGPASIWNLFFESPFGRRIAIASMALALLLGVYVVTSEQSADRPVAATEASQSLANQIAGQIPGEDAPAMVLGSSGTPDRDSVLVNLVTFW